jgi:cell division transport system ATP-binding protein
MNVYENVVLPLRFQNVNKDSYKSIIEENLNKVGLVHKIESNIESLSWGETQRVAIARAIINKPKLIIADEPTGNLDQKNSMRILSTLNSLVNENTTVIITTHATHLLENFPNGRILIMENGYLGGRHEK